MIKKEKLQLIKPTLLAKINFSRDEQEGFTKPKFEMLKFPWPLKDASVQEISCLMMLNYVPASQRGILLDEMYRVLIPGGKVQIAVPYWTSMRSIQDYAAEWPPFSEASFMYFNKDWRQLNHPDRTLVCNFDFSYGYQADQETAVKNDETRSFYIKHYTNAILDLKVELTKK